MRRLAVKLVPPGGSVSKTPITQKQDESPSGDSSPARRFLENYRKHENT